MTETEFKTKAGEIKEAIGKTENILLHLHPSPDPDSAGSVLALAEYCERLGKEVTVIGGDSDLSPTLSVLPGFARILPKSYGEINPADYDLFLVLDSAAITMISKKTKVFFPAEMTVINIDHHISNSNYGQINLVDTSAPAAAHILLELFLVWRADITPTMAANIYAGLHSDTGGFRYGNTTARTLELAALLLVKNPRATETTLALGQNFPKGLLRYKALAFSSIEEIMDGRGAIIALSFSDLAKIGLKFSDTEAASLPTELLAVKDWLVGATLVEKEPGRVRASFRSKDASVVDVSKIAAAFGGGGHALAAGALIISTLAEAKAKVVEAIGTAFSGQK
mgnify:CR=1 FL=1